MSRLVVVLPLEPLREGERFAVRDWPLHITVLQPFLTQAAPEDIMAAIDSATAARTVVTVRAGEDELFGRRHDIPVTVMVDDGTLSTLHQTLVDAVRPFATVPDEPTFTGSKFRAHVTVKPHGRVNEGDRLVLTQLALVDMSPRLAPPGRVVLGTLPLPVAKSAARRRYRW